MTFIVSTRVKNGVPQGQIFKSKELYRVVPQMKGLDEHFPDQLKFWRYDVIWWRNDVKSFPTRSKTHLFTPWVHVCPNAGMWVNACPNGEPESMHARMWGGLLQDTVSPLGDMVHFFFFFFFVCNHWCSDSFLTQQALHPYNISCIVVPQWQPTHWWHHFKVKVKGQGHIMVKVGCQRNPYFLSSFYQINSKLGVKVASELPLSWLIFGADRPWPSWVSLRVEICLPQGQILKSKVPYGTISCCTSYERSWWVLSKSTKILTLWRHLVTS